MLKGESVESRGESSRSGTSGGKDEITLKVSYKGVDKTFSGSVESVWLSVNRFFKEFLPSFEVAQRLTLNADLQKLAKDCEGLIAFTKEGSCLLIPRKKLTDNETLSLLLLAGYVGHQLGNVEADAVSKEELRASLAKMPRYRALD